MNYSKIKTAFKVLTIVILLFILRYPVIFLIGPLVKNILGRYEIADAIIVIVIFAVSLYLSLSLLLKKFAPEEENIISKWLGIAVFSLGLIGIILLHRFTVKDISLQLIIYPLLAYFETKYFLETKLQEENIPEEAVERQIIRLQEPNEIYPLPYTANGSKVCLILAIVFLIALIIIDKIYYLRLSGGIIFLSAPLFIFGAWISRFKVAINENEIAYSSFSGCKKILIRDIVKIEGFINVGGKIGQKNGYWIEIYDKTQYANSPFSINMAPFSRKDLKAIVNIIAGKAPSAETNEIIIDIKAGNFDKFALGLLGGFLKSWGRY